MWHTEIDTAMQQCIAHCQSCAAVCTETSQHCLRKGGQHAALDRIALMQLCAGICDLAAKSMQLGARSHHAFCRLCSSICDDCASDCESMGADDLMLDCARVCRECSESCATMAGAELRAVAS